MLTGTGVFLLLVAYDTLRASHDQAFMAKQRQENSPGEEAMSAKQPVQPRKSQRSATGLPWHPAWRTLVSLLVVLHLLAVIAAPWDLSTSAALPPSYVSPTDSLGRTLPPARSVWQEPVVTRWLRAFFNHYLNVLYLNHGYEFFAPDPAGTHVISYRVTQPGGAVVEGRFPDHASQWPRLLYHRHMMLADQSEMINNQLVMQAEQTGVRRPFSGQVFAEYLASHYGGQAQLDLQIHTLLSRQQVLAGRQLDDASTYRLLGTVNGNPRPERREPAATPQNGEVPIAIPGATQ